MKQGRLETWACFVMICRVQFVSENITAKQAWLQQLQNGFKTFLDSAAVVAAVVRVFVSLDKQTKADRKYPEIQCPASQSYLFVIHHD